MGRLSGRVALVTGAAQGIGTAFAKGLAREGAKVVISDLDSGEAVVEAIRHDGGDAIDAPADVSDEASANGAVKSRGRRLRSARYPCQQCRHVYRR